MSDSVSDYDQKNGPACK